MEDLIQPDNRETGQGRNFEYSSSVGEYDRKGTDHSEVNTEYNETTIVYSVPNENFQLTRPDQEKVI